MSTIRVKKDDRYFTASNESFQDKRLLWETRGLLGYLFTKPNNWTVRMVDLEKQGPAGNYKLRRMLADARRHGYMNRIRITKEDGLFDWITEVFESPSLNPRKSTSGGFSTSGSSTSGKLPDIVNTDSLKTESERFKGIAEKLAALCGGALNSSAADYINNWMEKHEDKYIYNALAVALAAKARSVKYVDSVLIGWEANGYPLPREERVKAARRDPRQSQEDILRKFEEKHGVQ